MSVNMEKAQKMIIDLIIALFTNSVSLGCGSVVFKNVCDAILGIVPLGGTSPQQQKAIFSILIDSVRVTKNYTNFKENFNFFLETNY